MRLKAEINWYRLFHELIQDFDMKVLAKRQKDALAKVGCRKLRAVAADRPSLFRHFDRDLRVPWREG